MYLSGACCVITWPATNMIQWVTEFAGPWHNLGSIETSPLLRALVDEGFSVWSKSSLIPSQVLWLKQQILCLYARITDFDIVCSLIGSKHLLKLLFTHWLCNFIDVIILLLLLSTTSLSLSCARIDRYHHRTGLFVLTYDFEVMCMHWAGVEFVPSDNHALLIFYNILESLVLLMICMLVSKRMDRCITSLI